MMPNNFIPIFVFWLNYIIVGINVFNVCWLFFKFRVGDNDEKIYILFLLLNAFSLLSVNIPSAISHYLAYFKHDLPMPEKIVWLRFWDRYSMFFKSIFNALLSSKYAILCMRKFYK